MRRCVPGMIAFACLPLMPVVTVAQLVVSANDNKAVLVDGNNIVPDNPAADTVTIIDLGVFPPKVIGEVNAPASVVGPPQSVAVSRDERFALVTGALKLDPANPKKLVPDDTLSVIDLKTNPPAVIARLEAGKGASGVSINRAGTLAMVANRLEGTVSVFTISGKTLTSVGKIMLGDARSQPSHVAFTPDGKMALVTRDGDHRISVLAIDGNKVEYTKHDMVGGYRPYSMDISAKGDVAVIANEGGGTGDADAINIVDLKSKPPRIVDTISVGPTPEGVAMSADGAYVAVTVTNGTNKPKSSPAYSDHGWLKIFAVKGTKLTKVAEARTGRWIQGVAWSRNSRIVVVQCMVEKELQLFRFNGNTLRAAGSIKVNGGPSGIRTADR
jgi:DNA-binding beta-propeller fold protein YncE